MAASNAVATSDDKAAHAEALIAASRAARHARAAPLARRREDFAGRRLKSDHEKFQDAHEKCMREFLAWDACTPDVDADDDALPNFPTDDFTPPPTSALWLKDICVNTANFIDTICSIRCECAEKEDAFYQCFYGEACKEWYSSSDDFSCAGYDGDLMYDQETCCLKDHEIFCEESKTCEFKFMGCPEGGDGPDACQMFQTWCEETETCIWSWEECGDPVLDPKPVPVPLDPVPTAKPTTKKPTLAPVAAPTSKPILPPTPRPSLTAAPTILPTTAAPSTTAAPTATPATAAPVAGSSPLGGDGVGDRDPNDDPSTDAAAARGVTVVAVALFFYAL